MKKLKLFVALGLVVAIAAGLWAWWRYEEYHPTTQDAYLRANIVSIAAQVPGQVTAVPVHENEHVKAGTVLFRIDPAQYRNAVDAAQAQVDVAEQARKSSESQIQAAEQGVTSARAALDTDKKQLGRTEALFASGNIPQASLDKQRTAVAQARAALDAAVAQLSQARSTAETREDNLAAAKAQLATARVNLDHTVVRAPSSGWVSNLSLRTGSTVAAYQPLFALVEDSDWWVEANFKETDLTRIRPGQPVTVKVDMLPGDTLHGHVASVGAGSGATFSLLPPQNASGNWVKVTQRFPVRIALDPVKATLRAGASVTATVDTTRGTGTGGQ